MPPQTVLYVEDDPEDVFLFRRALLAHKVECALQTVSSVITAKSYLGVQVSYGGRDRFPLPAVIVTDLAESSMDPVSCASAILRFVA